MKQNMQTQRRSRGRALAPRAHRVAYRNKLLGDSHFLGTPKMVHSGLLL